MGWTLAQWWTLTDDERFEWLAYDRYQMNTIREVEQHLIDKTEANTPETFALFALARL